MRTNYTTSKARRAVAARFGLPWEVNMQDWEIEVADPLRTEKFSNELLHTVRDEETICLLELTIASLDQLLEPGASNKQASKLWNRILPNLHEALQRFPDVAEYWVANNFPVGRLLRLNR